MRSVDSSGGISHTPTTVSFLYFPFFGGIYDERKFKGCVCLISTVIRIGTVAFACDFWEITLHVLLHVFLHRNSPL